MATIILLCNENYAPTVRQSIGSARSQLEKGKLDLWEWSVGKQPIAKVGDRVYIQRTNTDPPAGYFASGHVVSAQSNQQLKLTDKKYADFDDCYCDKFFDRKYVVELCIDSVVDYNFPLKLSDLEQRHEFEEANFLVPEGRAFDPKYARDLGKAWEKHLVSVQEKGVSAFTVLSKKGYEHERQKDFDTASQVYEKASEVAKSVGDQSWVDFFGRKKENCLKQLKRQERLGAEEIEKRPLVIEKVVGLFPDEVDLSEVLREGAAQKVLVNAYERNSEARRKCIERHGTSCSVCHFSFGKAFGKLGEGYIHVHHLKPLSEIGEEYEVNPIEDMLPVCPNCHAMLHRHAPPLSIEKLKAILDESKRDAS